jgi:NAD(P)H-hydrate epimerase
MSSLTAWANFSASSRLTGCALPIRDRLSAARDFAGDHGCILVLKGHGTVTAGVIAGRKAHHAAGCRHFVRYGKAHHLPALLHIRRKKRYGILQGRSRSPWSRPVLV